jgi:hypothetical protein
MLRPRRRSSSPARLVTSFAPAAPALGVLLSLLWSGSALAQQESAAAGAAPPRPDPIEEVTVQGPPPTPHKSPTWTVYRSFTNTRFWRLDKGQQAFEGWYTGRFKHDGQKGDNTHLYQVEYMYSPVRGLQLDLYFNYKKDKDEGAHIEGWQIEARIAPWDYGKVWGNPTLYLEAHPQTRGPNRAEARLLLGGELLTPRLRGAINPFYEFNLDSPNGVHADYAPEVEAGVTGAGAFAVVPDFAIGVEGRYQMEQQGKDENNPRKYFPVAKVGPTVWLRTLEGHLSFTVAGLFGATENSDAFLTTAIIDYRP